MFPVVLVSGISDRKVIPENDLCVMQLIQSLCWCVIADFRSLSEAHSIGRVGVDLFMPRLIGLIDICPLLPRERWVRLAECCCRVKISLHNGISRRWGYSTGGVLAQCAITEELAKRSTGLTVVPVRLSRFLW